MNASDLYIIRTYIMHTNALMQMKTTPKYYESMHSKTYKYKPRAHTNYWPKNQKIVTKTPNIPSHR